MIMAISKYFGLDAVPALTICVKTTKTQNGEHFSMRLGAKLISDARPNYLL